jgi:DNA replication and repair protein RecF
MLQCHPAMYLTHLSLTNFRNFIRLETDLPTGPTLLVGANAQGKTSFLEAIHFLAGGSSPHARSDRQLINFLALKERLSFARIVGEIQRQDQIQRIEIRIVLEGVGPENNSRLKKEILINGVKRRVGDLAGGFNTVLFLPQDMQVVEGSPGGRRRHLDAALCQADSVYANSLTEYGKVLTQRNALLRQLQERKREEDQLRFWDSQLTEYGAAIIQARAIGLREMESQAVHIHRKLTRERETLRLEYLPSYNPASPPSFQLDLPMETKIDLASFSRETIQEGFRETLRKSRREEIARGMTLIGPHRDDIRFSANGIDLRYYGSRGQNRTAMLSAKLAEVTWLKQRTGEWPVLLLDEVLAELDPNRRDDLLAHVGSVNQAILTTADVTMFADPFQEEATLWKIKAGTLSPIDPQSGQQ